MLVPLELLPALYHGAAAPRQAVAVAHAPSAISPSSHPPPHHPSSFPATPVDGMAGGEDSGPPLLDLAPPALDLKSYHGRVLALMRDGSRCGLRVGFGGRMGGATKYGCRLAVRLWSGLYGAAPAAWWVARPDLVPMAVWLLVRFWPSLISLALRHFVALAFLHARPGHRGHSRG